MGCLLGLRGGGGGGGGSVVWGAPLLPLPLCIDIASRIFKVQGSGM